MPKKCKQRFTVVRESPVHVAVRVASSCDDGKQWATNGLLYFTRDEWLALWPSLVAAGVQVVGFDDRGGENAS